ncbi:hypothetical protein [Flexivirga sp.]|uniref:hypothetical protein n=1 Tax=Flexivirga sp. TaxID=1962927 RepID=UPI003F801DFE
MPTKITESGAVATAPSAGGNMLVQIITPGEGSSGIYPAEVLEAAAGPDVFGAGTLMFADHPSESEMFERPERSIRDVAAVLVEDARWDGTALVAEARTFGPWTKVLTEMKDAIGVSIRASADVGEADRATGKPTIKRLIEGISVDFVTAAGRGGAIREVYESARARSSVLVRDATNPANIPVIREATADDTRDALQTAVRDAHPGEKTYAWVRDFDPDKGVVYFTVEDEQGTGMFQQSYELGADGTASLAGDPVEVNVRTEYVPVTAPAAESGRTSGPAPAGQPENTPIPNVQEDTMGNIQVDEAQYASVTEAAGRVPTLESERDTAVQERDTSRAELAEAHRVIDKGNAHSIVRTAAREAQVELDDYQVAGIAADYPTGEDGRLDADKLTESAKTAIAKLAEEAGAGQVRGFGSTTGGGDTISESDARAFLYGEQKGA